MGWHSAWTPAETGPGGGWAAGTEVLVRKSHGVRASLPVNDARAVGYLIDVTPGHTICVASVYGKTGESAQGPTNRDLQERLGSVAQDMKAAGIPFMVGGDWNLSPHEGGAAPLGETAAGQGGPRRRRHSHMRGPGHHRPGIGFLRGVDGRGGRDTDDAGPSRLPHGLS